MARRLVRRRAADDDVAEQLTYLASRRPEIARRYAWALERSFERIRRMSALGVQRWYGPRVGFVRVWPVSTFPRFLVFYKVTHTTVEIIRVLHSARNVSRALKRQDRRT